MLLRNNLQERKPAMKFSVNSTLSAIAKSEIDALVDIGLEKLRSAVTELVVAFVREVTPCRTRDLEHQLHDTLFAFAKGLLEQLLNSLETTPDALPKSVTHCEKSYRRLEEATPREVVTRFGKITLIRCRYRRGRSGRTIFPLEIALGLQQGFTPAAASIVGQQLATTGSTQGRTIEFVKDHLRTSIGTSRLRKLGRHLAAQMEPFREPCQLDQLMSWLEDARESKAKSVVLSVSRDAVSLGIAPWGYFEMASVATISVLADGKRRGTVYLGRTPETNQKTLSQQLSSLVRATLKGCKACSAMPHVVYVTDAGKTEAAYWKNKLSKFYVDGKRIKIHRVVDYYHASERLTVIADCLKFGTTKQVRWAWLESARKRLTKKGGHGRLMRSIAAMRRKYGVKSGKSSEFNKAVGYLKNQKRYMNYFAMKQQQFPIGSGVVESACKQVVTERMKLSGMRWKRPGAQVVMTLRCIKLSNIWNQVFGKMLAAIPPVSDVIRNQTPNFQASNCA